MHSRGGYGLDSGFHWCIISPFETSQSIESIQRRRITRYGNNSLMENNRNELIG